MDIKRGATEASRRIVSDLTSREEKKTESEKSSGPASVKDQFENAARNAGSLVEVPKRNDGIGGGHITPKIPGTGTNTGQPPASGPNLPTGETPAQRAKKNKDLESKDGKLAHPGDFSRETQLRNLLDPRSDLGPRGSTGSQKSGPGEKDPGALLGGASTLPSTSSGKNHESQDSLASEGTDYSKKDPKDWKTTYSGLVSSDILDTGALTTDKQGNVRRFDFRDANTGDRTTRFFDGKGHTTKVIEEKFKTGDRTTTLFDKDGNITETKTTYAPKKGTTTPDPEKDTGDHHGLPAGFKQSAPRPTIGEVKGQRKRQVTLPGDDQQVHDRVHADRKEAFKEGVRQRTDGRIDPDDRSGDGTTVGSGHHHEIPGSGVEKVDARRRSKLIPGGPPVPDPTAPSGGTPPDSPTADKGTGESTDDDVNRP